MVGMSVIVCCYNSSQRLPKTIEYLASQKTESNLLLEVVFVNNASTDNTVEVIISEWSKYQLKDIIFKLVEEPKPGLSFARSKGVESCLYDYILFCDDDNWLRSDYINNAYNIMSRNPTIGALGGHSTAISDTEKFPDWFEQNKGSYAVGTQADYDGDVTSREYIWGAGMVTRKESFQLAFSKYKSLLLDRSGYDLTSGGDSEYCLRLLFMKYRLYYSQSLEFTHFIPHNRLTEEYIQRLSDGFTLSYETIHKYSLLLYINSLAKPSKCALLLKSLIKLMCINAFKIKSLSASYESLVIYYISNYKSKIIAQEAVTIKKMFNEFKLHPGTI